MVDDSADDQPIRANEIFVKSLGQLGIVEIVDVFGLG